MSIPRREFLAVSAAAAGAATLSSTSLARSAAPATTTAPQRAHHAASIRHSVCRWCYSGLALDALCKAAADIGIESVELLDEADWPIPKRFGLTCAVANGPGSITKGWNRDEHHDQLVDRSLALLPKIADAGIPMMIVFSGNRAGLDDDHGLDACARGLRKIMPAAEHAGVTVVMELLNSKVDHHDYQCDRTPWGVRLCDAVGSPRFRLLYDIYHMQIMEGDVIRTIRDNIANIAHFHTGGVPGRREIDAAQELNYPAIVRAIAEAGFTGFLGQEFIPSRDPLASLREAVNVCTI